MADHRQDQGRDGGGGHEPAPPRPRRRQERDGEDDELEESPLEFIRPEVKEVPPVGGPDGRANTEGGKLRQVHGGADHGRLAQARGQSLAQVGRPAGVQARGDERDRLPGRRPVPAGRGGLQQGADDLLAPVRAVVRRVSPQQPPGPPLQPARVAVPVLVHVVLSFLASGPAVVSRAWPITSCAASAIRMASARRAADPLSVSP